MSRLRLIVVATVSVGVFAFVVIYLAKPSYAESSSSSFQTIQISQELQTNTCPTLVNIIDERIQDFNTNQDKNILNYQEIDSKIQKLIESKLSEGLDVLELKSSLNKYRDMTEAYKSEYLKFIGILEQAQKLGCNENRILFEIKVEEARIKLMDVKGKAEDIKMFLSTIKFPE